MKRDATKLLLWHVSITVLILQFVYLLWSEDDTQFAFFPYSNQSMTKSCYANFIGIYFSISVLFLLLSWQTNIKYWISLLWLGFLVDFLLTYNDPFMFYYTHGVYIPISYSLYMGVFLVINFGLELYKYLRCD